MSTKITKMWQGEIIVENLNVSDIIRELDISKSYLYKLIDKANIPIPKSETGRYVWDENIVENIKSVLRIDEIKKSTDTELFIQN